MALGALKIAMGKNPLKATGRKNRMKKKIAVGILIMLMAAGCGGKTEPVIRPVEMCSACNFCSRSSCI